MNKKELISEVGRPILKPLGIIQGLFVLLVVASPFVWIWTDFETASKIGITGVIGTVLIYLVYNHIKKVLAKEVDRYLKEKK